MEFTLKYRGLLPGGNASGKVEYISTTFRRAVHEQLADFWKRDPRLNGLKTDEFLVAQKSDQFTYDVPRPIQGTQNFFFRVPYGGIDFIPLVIRLRYLECQLVIDWHRHDPRVNDPEPERRRGQSAQDAFRRAADPPERERAAGGRNALWAILLSS